MARGSRAGLIDARRRDVQRPDGKLLRSQRDAPAAPVVAGHVAHKQIRGVRHDAALRICEHQPLAHQVGDRLDVDLDAGPLAAAVVVAAQDALGALDAGRLLILNVVLETARERFVHEQDHGAQRDRQDQTCSDQESEPEAASHEYLPLAQVRAGAWTSSL